MTDLDTAELAEWNRGVQRARADYYRQQARYARQGGEWSPRAVAASRRVWDVRAACGTRAGYFAHLRRCEVVCEPCRAADRTYDRVPSSAVGSSV